MTSRTHDLAAFGLLSLVFFWLPLETVSLGTLLLTLIANFVGGIAPDLDQPTGDLWQRLPLGTVFGALLHPFFGGHRHISHSILGVALFGFLLKLFLARVGLTVLVNMNLVWWGFMTGIVSHLLMDALTKEGVPLFFPFDWKFGFPPIKALRVTTGTWVEHFIVFPLLLGSIGFLYYAEHMKFLDFIRHFVK